MKVGSLFSGIGGLELGLERAGMEVVWQVEVEEWCRRVLARHFPNAVRYGDVRTCHGGHVADAECGGLQAHGAEHELRSTGEEVAVSGRYCLAPVDLICGGFPCQPVSHAGKRRGASDERWLWPEFRRIVCEVRPRWVVVENVPVLLSIESGRLFGGILADLAALGFDVEWDCIGAADLGAPHLRKRVFIVAHAQDDGQPRSWRTRAGWARPTDSGEWSTQCRLGIAAHGLRGGLDCGGWECGVPRVAKGQKDRVARLRGLGNAVVPQVAEYIGRLIMEWEL